ncbi:hypothetical protein GGP41_000599 [Bipolaris sorokiniana]|uniref:Uncharacterized protein n=1 Tax=Cochliobolus sativus TaxID=45130 RepID=A0A8H5ZN15_COCSA|nr:hypothetical protein GGP41_000599 [Bipolaris sorokiniana]
MGDVQTAVRTSQSDAVAPTCVWRLVTPWHSSSVSNGDQTVWHPSSHLITVATEDQRSVSSPVTQQNSIAIDKNQLIARLYVNFHYGRWFKGSACSRAAVLGSKRKRHQPL